MITRREFGTLALAGRVGPPEAGLNVEAAGVDSTVNGVHLGVQTYSFRDLPRPAGAADSVDVVIKAMKEGGLSECELFAPQLEPQFAQGARGQRGAPPSPEAVKAREDLRKWRLETPLDHFKNVRKKFDAAGIAIYAYCYNMNASFTDAEIDRGFEMTKALGADIMTDVDDDDGGQADRAVRRQAQDARRPARPLEHQRSERVRDAGELRRGDEDVEVLQGQPRHRPLHRRQLRRGRLHPRASRRHHQPAPEGPQEEPGRQHAVGAGRHADPRGAAAAEEASGGRFRADIEYEYRGDGDVGRGSEEVLRVREAGARMKALAQLKPPHDNASAWAWSAPASSARITSTRSAGSASSTSSAIAASSEASARREGRRARRAEGVRQLRGAGRRSGRPRRPQHDAELSARPGDPGRARARQARDLRQAAGDVRAPRPARLLRRRGRRPASSTP